MDYKKCNNSDFFVYMYFSTGIVIWDPALNNIYRIGK